MCRPAHKYIHTIVIILRVLYYILTIFRARFTRIDFVRGYPSSTRTRRPYFNEQMNRVRFNKLYTRDRMIFIYIHSYRKQTLCEKYVRAKVVPTHKVFVFRSFVLAYSTRRYDILYFYCRYYNNNNSTRSPHTVSAKGNVFGV